MYRDSSLYASVNIYSANFFEETEELSSPKLKWVTNTEILFETINLIVNMVAILVALVLLGSSSLSQAETNPDQGMLLWLCSSNSSHSSCFLYF